MAVKREKVHLESLNELLGAPDVVDGQTEIRIDQIVPFKDHPFKVLDDERMDDLVESIKKNGVLVPVTVRPNDNGGYEMISGHRRMHASKIAGLTTIPAIIKEMSDDEAIIAMVDSNMQREEILPSERAFSLKMKVEAMKRQGKRTDIERKNTSAPEEQKSGQSDSATSALQEQKYDAANKAGESIGLKQAQVRRYVQLTKLIPKLLDLIDQKRVPISTGVYIADFDDEHQEWIYEYFEKNGVIMKEQLTAAKKEDFENMTKYSFFQLLNQSIPAPKDTGRLDISRKTLNRYFPKEYSTTRCEEIILSLLADWKKERDEADV